VTQNSPINWRKEDDGAGGEVRVADLGTLTSMEVSMEFEQRKTALSGLIKADPDLVAGIGAGGMMVDLVDPKDNPTGKRINGAVQCVGGDAKGSGAEVVRVDVTRMLAEDGDINTIVLGGFCKGRKGFGAIAGALLRVYDTSTGERRHLANVRFDISSTESGVLACSLHQLADGGWEIRNQPRYGRAATVADLGNLFRTALR
jgi:hypothetical protein